MNVSMMPAAKSVYIVFLPWEIEDYFSTKPVDEEHGYDDDGCPDDEADGGV